MDKISENQRQKISDDQRQEVSENQRQEIRENQHQDEGRYIYCVIGDSEEKRFAFPGIGGGEREVYSVFYEDIAAVISASPVMRYSISRENTMAHQKILEELMSEFTVLPVKFGTVAGGKDGVCSSERIREEVLKARYEELKDLLDKMYNKIELGLKACWVDMKVIFQEIVDENIQIRKLRQKLVSKPSSQPIGEKAILGEMVKYALERKKEKEEKEILDVLREAWVDWRANKVFGDNMITNSAFLVEKPRVEEFDGLVDKLATTYDGRIKFKYVGPVPPINFLELVITLED